MVNSVMLWRLPNEPMPPTNGLRRIITPRDKVIFNGDGTARIEWAETEVEIKVEDLPHNAVFEALIYSYGHKCLWRVHAHNQHNQHRQELILLGGNNKAPLPVNITAYSGPTDHWTITRVLGIFDGYEEA
jgi:hypothetical protein